MGLEGSHLSISSTHSLSVNITGTPDVVRETPQGEGMGLPRGASSSWGVCFVLPRDSKGCSGSLVTKMT